MARGAGVVAVVLGLSACGLELAGVVNLGGPAEGDASTNPLGAQDADTPNPDDATSGDGGTTIGDATTKLDGASDPSKVSISYGIGKNQIVYAFDLVAKAFKALPSTGCPAGEE